MYIKTKNILYQRLPVFQKTQWTLPSSFHSYDYHLADISWLPHNMLEIPESDSYNVRNLYKCSLKVIMFLYLLRCIWGSSPADLRISAIRCST